MTDGCELLKMIMVPLQNKEKCLALKLATSTLHKLELRVNKGVFLKNQ